MMGLAATLLGLGQIGAAQLATRENGRPVFPVAFRGRWATEPAECGDDRLFRSTIASNSVTGYESHGRLLQISAVTRHRTPSGEQAYTVVARLSWSVEGEVATGRLRLSRVGDQLMQSNADEVSEAEHWAMTNVRCPDG